MTQPRIKFTVDDYMSMPEGTRYQLLDGEMILAPSPTTRHQRTLFLLAQAVNEFVVAQNLGEVFVAPYDVVFARYDVAQPDILFISNERSAIITEANIQGAPDLVIEVLSPSTARYDRGYKRTLYGRFGVREYWLVDPEVETAEVLTASEQGLVSHATYQRSDTLTSPLLEGLSLSLEQIFG
jgi:Uma2 family endonuclease